jgi:rubrerythrin
MSCTKKRFLSRAIAKQHMKKLNKSAKGLYAELTNVYQCPECGYWHFTSIKKSKSRAITRHGKKQKEDI